MLEAFGLPETILEEVEENCLQRIKQDAESAQNARSDQAKIWKSARKQYESEWRLLESDEQETALFIPETRSTVMRLITSLMSAFFSGSQFCKVRPSTLKGTDPEAATIMNRLVDYYLSKKVDLFELYYDAFQADLVDGNDVIKLTWEKLWDGEVLTRNRPRAETIPLEDVLIDPIPRRRADIRYMIHWKQMDIEELWARQDAGDYRNVEKVWQQQQLQHAGPAAGVGLSQTQPKVNDEDKKPINVYEYYGPMQLLPPDRIKELRSRGVNYPSQDVTITITPDYDQVLAGPMPSPYAITAAKDASPYEKLPFVLGCVIPGKGTYWGESIVWLMRGIQEEENRIVNERRKNVSLTLNPITLVDVNSGVDLEAARRARSGGGGFVPTEDLEGTFEEFAPGNVTAASYREEDRNRRRREELSGVSDVAQGVGRQGEPETATGMQILNEQGVARRGLYAETAKALGITTFVRKMAQYIIAFVEPEEVQQILGSYTTPPPLKDMISPDLDIVIEAGLEATSRSQHIHELMYGLQVVSNAGQVDPQMAQNGVRKIIAKLLPLLNIYDVAQDIQEPYEFERQGERRQIAANQQPRVPPSQFGPGGTRQGTAPERMPEMAEVKGIE